MWARKGWWILCLSVAGGGGIALSCRQIVGITDLTGATDAGAVPETAASCGISLGAGACGTCASAQCCAQARACADSAACTALEGCLAGCGGDPACRSQCTLDNHISNRPDQELAGALDACLVASCMDPCKLTCGALSQIAEPDAGSRCQTCLQQNACAETQACAASADCQRYLHCRENCSTGDCFGSCALNEDPDAALCQLSCGGTNPCIWPCSGGDDGGMTPYSTFATQAVTRCQEDCEVGNNWACLGRVQLPGSPGTPGTLTVGFADALTNVPHPGISVTMCPDLACSQPVDHATSNALGLVTLNEPLTGFGHLQISSPDASIYPEVEYWGSNLSQSPRGVLDPLDLVFEKSVWYVGLLAGGVTADPTAGHIAIRVLDCLGNPAPNVTFALSTDADAGVAVTLYFKTGSLTPNLTKTDTSGVVVFANVPLGNAVISATNSAGRLIGNAAVSVFADTLTTVQLRPGPASNP